MPNRRLNDYLSDGYFVGTTNYLSGTQLPAKRSDGTPLKIKDTFTNKTTGEEALWNGTYWLSKNDYVGNGQVVTNFYADIRPTTFVFNSDYDYFVTDIKIRGYYLEDLPSTYWYRIYVDILNDGFIYSQLQTTQTFGANFAYEYKPNILVTPSNTGESFVYIHTDTNTGSQRNALFLWSETIYKKAFK